MRPSTPNDFAIGFSPATADDLPLLRRWLENDHVRRWWGEPEEELQLIREGIETGEVGAFLFLIEGRPVGYIQSWTPSAYEEVGWARDFPADTTGIDIFIGDPGDIGKGIAPAVLRAFALRLYAQGSQRIIIDPDMDNRRAIRAYRAAGFRPFGEWREEDGSRTLLMEFPPDA